MFLYLLHVYSITPDGYTESKLLSYLAMYYVAIDFVLILCDQKRANELLEISITKCS